MLRPHSSIAVVTSTTTYVATTTAENSGACNGFNGACVVYGSEAGPASSTVYYAGDDGGVDNGRDGLGDGDGYIGPARVEEGDGQIGGSVTLKSCTSEMLIVLVLAIGMAMLLV